MQSKRARLTKKVLEKGNESTKGQSGEDLSNAKTAPKEKNAEEKINTNNFYEPMELPDYGGDLFQHEKAKLRQLDIRNVDNDLIPPKDWYSELRRGTLVMVRATLHAFNWKERRVRL